MPLRGSQARTASLEGMGVGQGQLDAFLCGWARAQPSPLTLQLGIHETWDRDRLRDRGRATQHRLPCGFEGSRTGPDAWEGAESAWPHAHTCWGVRVTLSVAREGDQEALRRTFVADLASGTYRLPPCHSAEVSIWTYEARQGAPFAPQSVHCEGVLTEGEPRHAAPFTVTGGAQLEPLQPRVMPRAPDFARSLDAWAETRELGGFAPIVQIRGFSGGAVPTLERDYVSGRFMPQGPVPIRNYGTTYPVDPPDEQPGDPEDWQAGLHNLGTKTAMVWLTYELEL